MERFHIALDVEERCAQFVRDVADETTLGGIQFHLSCEVLDRHGNAFEAFPARIAHRLEDESQGPRRFSRTAPKLIAVRGAGENGIEGAVQLHRQQLGKFSEKVLAFEVAPFPAEQAA